MNKVILTGRLTKDIETTYSGANQMAVARFGIAINRGKDKNGEDKGTDFINCVAFGKTAEFMEKYCGKGLRVEIDGHIQTGAYEKDGTKVYTTDVIVDRMQPIDWKDGTGAQAGAPSEEVPTGYKQLDEDIPF